jgi:nicotinamidase/pyrazinamidase
LDRGPIAAVFRKGLDPTVDSYSGFFDNGRRQATGLEDFLRQRGADELFICGLATDYCVKYTALDAVALGFRTRLVAAACRGVELRPGDVARALAEMAAEGVAILQ